jgi:hypothetical protein
LRSRSLEVVLWKVNVRAIKPLNHLLVQSIALLAEQLGKILLDGIPETTHAVGQPLVALGFLGRGLVVDGWEAGRVNWHTLILLVDVVVAENLPALNPLLQKVNEPAVAFGTLLALEEPRLESRPFKKRGLPVTVPFHAVLVRKPPRGGDLHLVDGTVSLDLDSVAQDSVRDVVALGPALGPRVYGSVAVVLLPGDVDEGLGAENGPEVGPLVGVTVNGPTLAALADSEPFECWGIVSVEASSVL